VTNSATLKTFYDMIVTVRDRVQEPVNEGRTESEVVAQRPTSDFAAQWGHGRVAADDFAHEIYRALKEK
jgi:hypothetical protein